METKVTMHHNVPDTKAAKEATIHFQAPKLQWYKIKSQQL